MPVPTNLILKGTVAHLVREEDIKKYENRLKAPERRCEMRPWDPPGQGTTAGEKMDTVGGENPVVSLGNTSMARACEVYKDKYPDQDAVDDAR